jgi:hypothetical protein
MILLYSRERTCSATIAALTTPNVLKFCRKCGKPIVSSRQRSAAAPLIPVAPPLVDPPPGTVPVVKAIQSPTIAVVTPEAVSSAPYAAKPRAVRDGRHMIPVVAASIAVIFDRRRDLPTLKRWGPTHAQATHRLHQFSRVQSGRPDARQRKLRTEPASCGTRLAVSCCARFPATGTRIS